MMEVKVGFDHIEKYNEYMEPKIREYEQEEIVTGQIVFYGPSCFTRWSTKYGAKPLAESLLDNDHYNAYGYEMYTKVYQEALKEELDKY